MSHFRVFDGSVRLLPFLAFIAIGIVFGATGTGLAQDKGKYWLGEDNKLEIVVHIIGEVKKPGKYRVRDDTNLIDFLSEAGGPTEFSDLGSVTITHADLGLANGHNGTNHDNGERIIKYNVNKYLKEENALPPPILRPGDVVLVPSNNWRTWRTVATILRDIAIVASAYFLYLRATKD